MSARSSFIIVSGPPGSGKTSLARKIADEFRLPFIARDDIKESLFDSLGTGDRAWSQQLGRATYELMYCFAATQLAAGRSFIIESNFNESAPLDGLLCKPSTILCLCKFCVMLSTMCWSSDSKPAGYPAIAIPVTSITKSPSKSLPHFAGTPHSIWAAR